MKHIFKIAPLITIMLICSQQIKAQLSAQEKQDLIFLREEEKLARDVYLFSLEKYDEVIFRNISQSEQRHIDAMLGLLEVYNLPDPAAGLAKGKFNNSALQHLYDSLTKRASLSKIEALKAGAFIEDLDLKDIKHFVANTQRSDILSVYERLACGSKNHMRAFSSWLKAEGISYKNLFIADDEMKAILAGENRPCGGGKGMRRGKSVQKSN